MGILKSEKKSESSAEKNNTVENIKELDPNQKLVLDTVNSVVEGGAYRDDELVYSKFNLSIVVRVHEIARIRDLYSVQLAFYVRNPYFDEPIVEVVSGIGKTGDEACKNGAIDFAESVLKQVFKALAGNRDAVINSEIMGITRTFRKCAENETLTAGCENTNMVDLWQIVREEMPLYLGTKKVYWVKLFTACSNGKPTCEVRINNIVYPQLTQKLFKYVKTWSDMINYHSEKQFVVLIQDEKTFKECSFTKEQVMQYAIKTIALLQQVDSEETRKSAVNTVKMMCKDDILALELCTFLPEIYTQIVFNLKESDGLVAVMGENKYPLRKSQLRVYGYIEDAVHRYLHFEKPSKEQNVKVMCLSGKMSALNKLVKDGGIIEDTVFPAFTYFVNDNYVVR